MTRIREEEVESTTDLTGNGTGQHYIMTQCAGSSSSRLNNRLDRWWYRTALHHDSTPVAVDSTTVSTGNGTGLHYVMTQYGGSSRIDNRLDR